MRKYLTGSAVSPCPTTQQQGSQGRGSSRRSLVFEEYEKELLTIVDLLECDLRILWQIVLGCIGQHECLWLLRGRHCCRVVLGIHGHRAVSHSS